MYERDEDGDRCERDEHERPGEAHQRLLRRKVTSGRSQSPDVVRTTWRTPTEESARATCAALGRRRDGESLAEAAAARVDAELPPGLRIDEVEEADVRQLLLAWVPDLDGDDVMVPGELEQRLAASPADRGSPRRRRRASAAGRARPRGQSALGERARAGPVRRRLAPQSREQPDEPDATLPRRNRVRLVAAERDDTEPVAAPGGEVADRDGYAFGDVRLPPVSGAELHRDRRVEHEPRDEHALGEIDADVRLARARRDVPVDPPHVVARRRTDASSRARSPCRAGSSGSRPRGGPRRAARSRRRARGEDPRPSGRGPGAPASVVRGARRRSSRVASCRADAREVELRRRHRREHLVEDRVRSHLLRERLVRQDEPVSQGVARQRLQVVDDRVLAPADQRERARALDEADRAARARAVGDVLRELRKPVPAGSRVAVAMSTA